MRAWHMRPLEREGAVLLKPFCPPYYNSMADAVRTVVEIKYGMGGVFRTSQGSAWVKHDSVVSEVPRVSEAAVEATIAYCEYLWSRYGRFPVYVPPYRTVLGFQACHLDVNFYDRFYQPGALSETVRSDFERSASLRADAKL